MKETIDVAEHGAERGGQPQVMDRRLFMQLSVWRLQGGAKAIQAVQSEIEERDLSVVLYAGFNDPHRYGLLSWSEDPAFFPSKLRPLFSEGALREAEVDPAMAMSGRTYSVGYEPDLAHFILRRPVETVLNPAWPWAIWYPLRRKGTFAQLERKEQAKILGEHARIGKAYGMQDLAHDVRLSCYGIDTNDNDFVIGLVGKDLHPLSHVVQSMRKTRQTSEFIEVMGPFFVGHALWRHQSGQG